MKVTNMTSPNGKPVPNQFIIEDTVNIPMAGGPLIITRKTFQSYESIIVVIRETIIDKQTLLDTKYWNYSKTTSKNRNLFLNETTAQTQAKIDNGEYILTNLN